VIFVRGFDLPRWIARYLPTRDGLLANRWIRPFAHRLAHPLLWHVNRRSIARGVALGLFAGFLVPLGQTPAAAAMAFTARANVLIAACATLVTNPFTFPPIYYAAYKAGVGMMGGRAAAGDETGILTGLAWLYGLAAPTALGLFLFGTVSALLGYALVHLAWRWRIARRWRRRARARAA
jgi:uncharacterized protein (DUF2062 family)